MKINKYITAVLIVFLLVPMLFSCDKGPTEETETGSETKTETEDMVSQTTEEQSPLKINGISLNEYTVVYSKTSTSGSKEAFSYLNKKLDELYGVMLKSSAETNDGYEILIGLNGGDQTIAEEYKKSPDGFIGVSGKKIFLMGLNYGALCQVIDSFLSKAAGTDANKEISITGSENVNIKKDSINVMSYNVLVDLNKAGRRDDCLNEILATIRSEAPDVFGTQEDNDSNNKSLMKGLPEYSCYQGAEIRASSKMGNYVYWKTDKFNVVSKGFFYMSDTPGAKSKFEGSNDYRAFTYIILESKETGKRFMFINLHTDYRAEESVRVKQLEVLTSLLKKINRDNLPTVIVGDFNTTAKKSSITTFEADNPRFGMTSEVAKTKGDTGSTLAVTEFTARSSYVFDYIFVTTDKIDTQYYTVVDNIKDGKYPSDHLPVVAHIIIY